MDPMTVLESVNSFYRESFSNLVSLTFGVVAFIGILIPGAATWMQIRALKSEKASIKRELESEMQDLHNAFSEKIKTQIEVTMKQKAEEFEKRLSNADASSFHIQGLFGLNNEHYVVAIEDFVNAAEGYVLSDDEMNAQRCLRIIHQECLPRIDKEFYEEFAVSVCVERMVEFLKKENVNGRYTNVINEILIEAKLASTREEIEDTENDEIMQ